jgi:hypothetical protein
VTTTLLDQFLAEECTPYVRRLLEEAIANTAVLRPHFEFNRFEVTVERTDNSIILEDVLDATESGAQTVPLPDFVHALNRRSA